MRLVLVDVDGTLISGESTERSFIKYLWRQGQTGWRQWLSALHFTLRWLPRYGKLVGKKNKAYLTGLSNAEIGVIAREFVYRELSARIRGEVCTRLQAHRQAGDRVVLLTGTPDFIAQPLAELLEVTDFRATVCATRDGRFICAPPLSHPYEADKLKIAQALCRCFEVTMDQVVAYADDVSDLGLLEAVGCPVAVSADPGLRAAARTGGWEMLDCHS